MRIGGWFGGKPTERGSVGEVVEAQRLRILDQRAENAAAARQVADRRLRLGVDAGDDEPLERLAGRIDARRAPRTERRSARPRPRRSSAGRRRATAPRRARRPHRRSRGVDPFSDTAGSIIRRRVCSQGPTQATVSRHFAHDDQHRPLRVVQHLARDAAEQRAPESRRGRANRRRSGPRRSHPRSRRSAVRRSPTRSLVRARTPRSSAISNASSSDDAVVLVELVRHRDRSRPSPKPAWRATSAAGRDVHEDHLRPVLLGELESELDRLERCGRSVGCDQDLLHRFLLCLASDRRARENQRHRGSGGSRRGELRIRIRQRSDAPLARRPHALGEERRQPCSSG